MVGFPGTPGAACPGPNYIVQGKSSLGNSLSITFLTVVDYAIDWAIVQTQNWTTLYILSRERQPAPASIDVSFNTYRYEDRCANTPVGLD